MNFAPCAGGRRFETPESGAGGSGGQPASGNGDPNNAGKDQFDIGYGKGIGKGRDEGMAAVLRELGVATTDEAKALAKAARDAAEAAKKATEEQGQFKPLYEQEKAARAQESAELAKLRKQVEQIETAQKAELAKLTEKFGDDQKALLDGLPLDKQLQLARALGAGTGSAVGAAAGKGTTPNGGDAKAKLAAYAKKGVANLTKEERADMHALLAEVDQG